VVRIVTALSRIPERRELWPWLFLINFAGALYGFVWYRQQLSLTPIYLWPLVADSPVSALLFSFVILSLYYNRRLPALEALAYPLTFKYGLWATAVIGAYWLSTGRLNLENGHLLVSHLGMAAETVIFFRYYPVPRRYLVLGLTWLLVNDLVDYPLADVHPYLPSADLRGFALVAAFALSVASYLVFANLRSVLRREK